MNSHETALCSLFGIGALIALYWAVTNDDMEYTPQNQQAGQTMGMNTPAGIKLGEGTPLDLRPEVHFWSPGTNPRDANPPCGVITTPHRYPAIPGGNISTVMHKGWSAMNTSQPYNQWFETPPETAVL